MIVLTVGLMLLVGLHQYWLYCYYRRFDAIHPYTLCDIFLMIFFGIGIWFSNLPPMSFLEQVAFASSILIGVIALYAGYHLGFPRQLRIGSLPKELPPPPPKPFWLWCGTLLFIAITLWIVVSRMQRLGLSLWDYFALKPLMIYTQIKQAGDVALPAVLFSFFSVAAVLLFAQALERRQWLWVAGLYLLLVGSIVAIANTRIPVLMFATLPIAFWHYRVRSLNKWFITVGLAIAPFLMAALHVWRGGAMMISLNTVLHETVVHEGYYYLWSKAMRGDLEYEYGLNYLYFVLTFVPRSLWADKPDTSFETRWTSVLQGGLFDSAGQVNVWTFTPWGEGLTQAGVLGIIVNLFLFGACMRFAVRYFEARLSTYLIKYIYAISSATYLRTGFQAIAMATLIYVGSIFIFENLSKLCLSSDRRKRCV
jgi:hypothetical protein